MEFLQRLLVGFFFGLIIGILTFGFAHKAFGYVHKPKVNIKQQLHKKRMIELKKSRKKVKKRKKPIFLHPPSMLKPKHRLTLLAGYGPQGTIRRSIGPTAERFEVGMGLVMGVQYSVSMDLSTDVVFQLQSNDTYMGGFSLVF